jgi:PPOX class probable F420-dependent enzyme
MTDTTTPVIPASHADLLESKAVAHLATVGTRGYPQNTPIWFVWDGEHVKFSLTTGRQKYRNIGRDPKVALTISDPANPYRYLEIRGTVTRIDADPDKAFIDECAQKYLGTNYPWNQPGDERVVCFITPEHTSTMG